MTDRQEAIESGRSRTPRWYHALIAGLLHAVLMLGAFPPISLWALCFAAPLPLLSIAWTTHRPFRHALLVLLGATPFYAYHCIYIMDISFAGYPPLILYLAAWPALFVWMGAVIHRRLPALAASVLLPVVWVGVDVLRGEVAFGGFEWYQVSQPLIAAPPLARVASYGGQYAVTLLLMIPVASALDLRSRCSNQRRLGWVMTSVSLAFWALGAFIPAPVNGADEHATIALVQTNVPQDNKLGWSYEQRIRDFNTFVELTERAAASEPDLIVWPETMFPGIALDEATASMLEREQLGQFNEFRHALLALQESVGIPMLVGAQRAENMSVIEENGRIRFENEGAFNAAFVVSDGRVQDEHYDKLSPTPFGETLPYIKNVSWLQDLVLKIGLGASGMNFGLDSGTDPSPLVIETNSGQLRVATPICFESTQSSVCRRIATTEPGADLVILMTNDGWFGDFDTGRQVHLLLARWRCVELGLPMARCANTGISCFIDRFGNVTAQSPAREADVVVGGVSLQTSPTVYRSIGNLVGLCALAGLGMLWLLAIRQRFKAGAAPGTKKDE